MIRAKAWLAPIRNAPPESGVAQVFGNRILRDPTWAQPMRYRDMGAWRFYAYWTFWKPLPRLWGVRWGLVLAWGRLPRDWFDQT